MLTQNRISIHVAEAASSAPQRNLAADEIHIWQAQLDRSAAELAQLHALLSADEKVRAARFHFDRDRNRYIVARAWLRQWLGCYLAISPTDIRFAYSRQGKPQLDLASPSPSLHFNLAHSADQAIFAFAHSRVGIDIETIRPDIDCDLLAAGIFSAQELSTWQALPASAKQPAFFSLWSRKEALVKANGEGLGYPLQQLTVGFRQTPSTTLEFVAEIATGAEQWSLYDIPVAPGYCGALAVLR